MKKLAFKSIFFIPIITRATNLPAPDLPDESVTSPIDSTIFYYLQQMSYLVL